MENKNLIMMMSVTSALKAKEVLAKKGIRSELVRTPKHKAKSGCGYSLYIPGNFQAALTAVRTAGIKIMGTIDNSEDG